MSIQGRLRRANERMAPGHLINGPETFVLGVNNHCNLHCRMCDVGTGNFETNFGGNLVGAKTRMMPFDMFERIADEIASWCPSALLAFVYTEPLAWPHIAKAVARATELGLRTQITTNGLLLPRHAQGLADAGLGALTVSIDGPEPVHDFIRRKQGSYAKALEGIAQIKARNPALPVEICCAITQWNVGHLTTLADNLVPVGIDTLYLLHNQFTSADSAESHNALHPDIPATPSNIFESDTSRIDLDGLRADLGSATSRELPFRVHISPDITDMDGLETYYRRPETYVTTHCTDPFRILMIDSDGEVIPAHGRCFRFPIGNIDAAPLRTLWNASSLAHLRKTLTAAGGLLPACSRCCGGAG